MRKLAILGAFALTLTLATPVFAASHTTKPVSAHPAVAASRTLKAAAASGKTSMSSRLTVAANGKSGTFWVSLKGEAPKSRDTSVLDVGGCSVAGDTAVITLARTIRSSGTWSGTAKLSKAEIAKLQAALKAGRHLSVTSTDGAMHLCGAFSG